MNKTILVFFLLIWASPVQAQRWSSLEYMRDTDLISTDPASAYSRIDFECASTDEFRHAHCVFRDISIFALQDRHRVTDTYEDFVREWEETTDERLREWRGLRRACAQRHGEILDGDDVPETIREMVNESLCSCAERPRGEQQICLRDAMWDFWMTIIAVTEPDTSCHVSSGSFEADFDRVSATEWVAQSSAHCGITTIVLTYNPDDDLGRNGFTGWTYTQTRTHVQPECSWLTQGSQATWREWTSADGARPILVCSTYY
jgi:hypothetical protein